ncbi:MAG: serine hydrolase [Eubacteriales bacterium]|nr:serine hydrolase [Eubacteriales bacterium]MDD4512192.1 serine hydrolase [Eubacteriales bacterium]
MKKKTKIVIIVITSILLIALLAVGGLAVYGEQQMNKIPALTAAEILEYTTKDSGDAVITVGIIKGGEASYKVYGKDGQEHAPELHTYEIGSLTKTITAALVKRAIDEGKINIDSTIDSYLALPEGKNYPTIKELLTYTSGYKGYYFESPMIATFLTGKNEFCGITKEMVLSKVSGLNMDKESYGFEYSNFGYAVLGLVLESVYDTDYAPLLTDYAQNALGLKSTKISDKSGDLKNYWDWNAGDAYIPAGAVTSNIADMLAYAQMQLSEPFFSDCHKSIKAIDASSKSNRTMDINMDEIGMAWIIDSKNNIVWHNGGTGHYNSYLGFDIENGTAVVVLSNLAPNYRIPATVLGVKLLLELRAGK